MKDTLEELAALRPDLLGDMQDFGEGDEYEENLGYLVEGLKAKIGDTIVINDISPDIEFQICTREDSQLPAHLVIESDGCVRWYNNYDDNADTVVRQVPAKTDAGRVCKECGELILEEVGLYCSCTED